MSVLLEGPEASVGAVRDTGGLEVCSTLQELRIEPDEGRQPPDVLERLRFEEVSALGY